MKSHGKYYLNPASKKRRKKSARRRKVAAKRRTRRARRMKNPIPYGIVLVNPRRRKRRSSSKRRRNAARRRARATPSPVSASTKTASSPSMKKRRSGRRRHRNASRRRTRRRSSVVVIRNPSRGRRGRRMRRLRNPVGGIVGDIFGSDNLTLGAGIVVSQVGSNVVLNNLRSSRMAASGSLPGLKPGQESWLACALYKLVIGAGVGYLLRNQAPRFARGMIIGSVAAAMSDVVMQTGVLRAIPGAGRYFPASRGAQAYLPGTSTRFTGPGSTFLQNGARPGLSARVGPGLVGALPNMVANPFN